jgi:hypothetical protein
LPRISSTPPNSALIEELLSILDEEIALLNKKSAELEALSGAIIERDDERLVALLGEMEQTLQAQSATDVKLDALRMTFAEITGCSHPEMKLSRLIEELGESERVKVDYRRQQIVILAERLKDQYMAVAITLRESARINRVILEGLFPEARPVTTYSASGPKSWTPETGLLDSEM